MIKHLAIATSLTVLMPQLVIADECDYDSAYIAGLDTIAEKVPDMEQHAPYQVVEKEDHWLVVGYSGPGHPIGLVPTAKIDKNHCQLQAFYFSE